VDVDASLIYLYGTVCISIRYSVSVSCWLLLLPTDRLCCITYSCPCIASYVVMYMYLEDDEMG
jgi:hypothetical protein